MSATPARTRTAALISGRGSNMLALADAAADPSYPAEIALVLSDVADAPGLERARAMGLAAQAVPRRDFADRAQFEAALDAALDAARIDLVCLAGFMRVLSADFVTRRRDKILNIHPSLLPAFPGLDTHARALAAGAKVHGATVHLVRPAVDDGPILAQAALAVRPDDDADSLAARVLTLEHRLYPATLARWAAGADWRPAEGALINPLA